MFFEMCIRVARSFGGIGDYGQTRLYMSRAADLKDELEDVFLGTSLKIQFGDALCLYHAERIRLVLEFYRIKSYYICCKGIAAWRNGRFDSTTS